MKRILYPIQQISLNERGLVALCLGLVLLAYFKEKRPRNRCYFTKYWLICLWLLLVLLL
ncbi:MAG: hypothetical protein HFP77_01695 [Methylococcales symbiont of Iophon sp. n. MRB-2018]|nr:MAG: hypothetical protein HFP77_01695 [Methylococcales symbiont of Iophon sp. n. MRB-2018]KAF3979285.1 MAG: hypothetical protein HFP76_08420 [Methylococcales symbiont of Iophon sp. n. MRB-2018]